MWQFLDDCSSGLVIKMPCACSGSNSEEGLNIICLVWNCYELSCNLNIKIIISVFVF